MTIQRKLRGVVQIVRPELPLAAGMCVVIGECLGLGALPPSRALLLGATCGFCLASSAMATNDYYDLDVDRINAPARPLPSGLLLPREAMSLGLVTGALGLAAAWGLSPAALVLGGIVWIIGFLYNWKLKATGLPGNLSVAFSVGMTFVIGGIGVGRPWNGVVWLFGLMALVFDLAEEIASDAMDSEGDRQRGSRSIAIVHGRATALGISAGLFGVMILLTGVPLVRGRFGASYGIPILLTDLFIVVFVVRLLRSRTPREGRQALRALYIGGSLGLLAFLVGAFVK